MANEYDELLVNGVLVFLSVLAKSYLVYRIKRRLEILGVDLMSDDDDDFTRVV